MAAAIIRSTSERVRGMPPAGYSIVHAPVVGDWTRDRLGRMYGRAGDEVAACATIDREGRVNPQQQVREACCAGCEETSAHDGGLRMRARFRGRGMPRTLRGLGAIRRN